MLDALTPTGPWHIEKLHLNRPALVDHRRAERRLQSERQELAALRDRLAELKREEEDLERELL